MSGWCCVTGPGPQWQRSAYLDKDGEVFVPAFIACGDPEALLATGYDGTDVVLDEDEHLYVPASWVRANYPEAADLATKIESKVREHFSK